MLGEVGMFLADAGGGEPVENAELALAQALVDDRLARRLGDPARLADRLGGLAGADIGRGQDDFGPLGLGQRRRTSGRAPAPARWPSVAERHVDVAQRDVDHVEAGRVARRRARHCRRSARGGRSTAFRAIFVSSAETKREPARAKGSEQAFGLQPGAQVGGVGEEMRLHPDRQRRRRH